MNQIPVLKELARLAPRQGGFPRADYHLNIVLVHEDERTHRWSREVLARVREVAGEQSVRSTCWNIADFKESGVLAGVVSMAIKADIIVAAFCETKKMRLPFLSASAKRIPARQTPSVAICALSRARLNWISSSRNASSLSKPPIRPAPKSFAAASPKSEAPNVLYWWTASRPGSPQACGQLLCCSNSQRPPTREDTYMYFKLPM